MNIVRFNKFPINTNLGMHASAIHRRSILQANTGRWGYGISLGAIFGFPFVNKISVINCKFVSHLTGSPNNITAIKTYQ